MRTVREIAEAARAAAGFLAGASPSLRQKALNALPEALSAARDRLFDANARDLEDARQAGTPEAFMKRLQVSEKIFAYMLKRLKEAASLPDPLGRVLEGRLMPSGLQISKVSVPIGVIGIIYEARPNVTTDAAAVALRSGNAVILRGGSESARSNAVLVDAMRDAVASAGLLPDAVQYLTVPGHEAVAELLRQKDCIDLIIPRGGKSLIAAVDSESRIPVLKHYDGICHLYIAEDADTEMAVSLAVNSKCERVEVCNALETLLVDVKCAGRILPPLADAMAKNGVELRGCPAVRGIIPTAKAAVEEDWGTEYLAPVLSVKVVDGIDEAMCHIAKYGSRHTDGIVTSSLKLAEKFTRTVDSASVLVNASTRLSGGGDYGMGAVVGISTDKLHARGPVGPAELCTYKWIAMGNGHLRS